MKKLIQAHRRLQTELFGSQRKSIEGLAEKLQPKVLFITCSDFRVNPNLLTQPEPGERFILLNAGNIAPQRLNGIGQL